MTDAQIAGPQDFVDSLIYAAGELRKLVSTVEEDGGSLECWEIEDLKALERKAHEILDSMNESRGWK